MNRKEIILEYIIPHIGIAIIFGLITSSIWGLFNEQRIILGIVPRSNYLINFFIGIGIYLLFLLFIGGFAIYLTKDEFNN